MYELVEEGGAVVVKATSEAAASGLTKEVKIDPSLFPIVQWRWKVENLLTHSDVTRKSGDDYPARLYITFEYDPERVSLGRKLKYKAGRALFGDIPIAAINYIWDTKTPVGTVVDNAYTDFAKMIVVEGTLYPLLTRLKNAGLLEYKWVESKSGPPRKYYKLTDRGQKFLEKLTETWDELIHSTQMITSKA